MSTDEQESKRKASIELANAYREMMGMFAWKHLNGVLLARIKAEATVSIDQMPIAELTVGHVAEARGMRKAVDQIASEIAWILDGHEAITR